MVRRTLQTWIDSAPRFIAVPAYKLESALSAAADTPSAHFSPLNDFIHGLVRYLVAILLALRRKSWRELEVADNELWMLNDLPRALKAALGEAPETDLGDVASEFPVGEVQTFLAGLRKWWENVRHPTVHVRAGGADTTELLAVASALSPIFKHYQAVVVTDCGSTGLGPNRAHHVVFEVLRGTGLPRLDRRAYTTIAPHDLSRGVVYLRWRNKKTNNTLLAPLYPLLQLGQPSDGTSSPATVYQLTPPSDRLHPSTSMSSMSLEGTNGDVPCHLQRLDNLPDWDAVMSWVLDTRAEHSVCSGAQHESELTQQLSAEGWTIEEGTSPRHGAFATVVRARRTTGGDAFAIKVFEPHVCLRQDADKLLQRLDQTTSHTHPGIVRYHAAMSRVTGVERPWLVMDWVDTHFTMDSFDFTAHQVAPPDRLAFCTALIDAVRTLHTRNVPHGDLHPGNVMVVRDDDGNLRPVLVDLGVVMQTLLNGLGTTSSIAAPIGRSPYAAPEVNLSRYDRFRADVHALAALCVLVLAETNGLGFQSREALMRALSQLDKPHPDVAALLHAWLTEQPDGRPENAIQAARAWRATHDRGGVLPGSTLQGGFIPVRQVSAGRTAWWCSHPNISAPVLGWEENELNADRNAEVLRRWLHRTAAAPRALVPLAGTAPHRKRPFVFVTLSNDRLYPLADVPGMEKLLTPEARLRLLRHLIQFVFDLREWGWRRAVDRGSLWVRRDGTLVWLNPISRPRQTRWTEWFGAWLVDLLAIESYPHLALHDWRELRHDTHEPPCPACVVAHDRKADPWMAGPERRANNFQDEGDPSSLLDCLVTDLHVEQRDLGRAVAMTRHILGHLAPALDGEDLPLEYVKQLRSDFYGTSVMMQALLHHRSLDGNFVDTTIEVGRDRTEAWRATVRTWLEAQHSNYLAQRDNAERDHTSFEDHRRADFDDESEKLLRDYERDLADYATKMSTLSPSEKTTLLEPKPPAYRDFDPQPFEHDGFGRWLAELGQSPPSPAGSTITLKREDGANQAVINTPYVAIELSWQAPELAAPAAPHAEASSLATSLLQVLQDLSSTTASLSPSTNEDGLDPALPFLFVDRLRQCRALTWLCVCLDLVEQGIDRAHLSADWLEGGSTTWHVWAAEELHLGAMARHFEAASEGGKASTAPSDWHAAMLTTLKDAWSLLGWVGEAQDAESASILTRWIERLDQRLRALNFLQPQRQRESEASPTPHPMMLSLQQAGFMHAHAEWAWFHGVRDDRFDLWAELPDLDTEARRNKV